MYALTIAAPAGVFVCAWLIGETRRQERRRRWRAELERAQRIQMGEPAARVTDQARAARHNGGRAR